MSVDKNEIVAALLARARADLSAIEESRAKTAEGAVHEEARAEDDKDTRAIEQQYLAAGLAQRVEDLHATVAGLSALGIRAFADAAPIALSALVTVEDEDGRVARYLLAPAGGGMKVTVGGEEVVVVTPKSPLGRALVGKRAGDDFEVRTPKGVRASEIVDVS